MASGHLPIGQRIAAIRRRRGLSQAQVAHPLGKSVQWLSNIERGVRAADRYSVLVPIAGVLGVQVAELTGDRPVAATLPDPEHEAVRALRLALSESAFAPARIAEASAPAGDREELRERVRELWGLVHEARYADLGRAAPPLVHDCERAVRAAGPARRDALLLLAELYQGIAAAAARLGEVDLAWVTADRSTLAAAQAEDPVLAAGAGFRLGHCFLNAGRLDEASRAVVLAAAALEPASLAGDVDAMALRGALDLVAAIAAARRGEREAALAAVARAREAADRLGPGYVDVRCHTEFGARNVALHAVAVAVELGDAAEAMRQWRAVDTTGLSSERRARVLVDLARAHARERRAGAAVQALEEAERLAPEMVRSHWLARDTVRELLRRERGRAKPGRLGMARRMGLV